MARTSRSWAVPSLLLFATLIAGAAFAEDDDDQHHKSICDDADCGRGTCVERLGWIPWRASYKCECDPRWKRAITMVASSPCNVPESCVAVNCGSGECKKDKGFHYHCECEPGFANMLNNTKFPCVDHNCKASSRSRPVNDR
nr:unnamed protein product [Digitaria exilis]